MLEQQGTACRHSDTQLLIKNSCYAIAYSVSSLCSSWPDSLPEEEHGALKGPEKCACTSKEEVTCNNTASERVFDCQQRANKARGYASQQLNCTQQHSQRLLHQEGILAAHPCATTAVHHQKSEEKSDLLP